MTAGPAPGLERLGAGVAGYLDACLATHGTKAFLAQSRTDTDLLDEVHARNGSVAAAIETDLSAIGWPNAGAVAHLLVAMVAEIALTELYAREPRPELRAAALTLVTHPAE